MTRNEKIELLERYSTFLASHGYMDDDWRSEPPFAIDRFLALTEEPSEQKPLESPKFKIGDKMVSVFSQGKDNDGTFFNWYERNDMRKIFELSFEEYSLHSKQQARIEAIQECIEAIKENFQWLQAGGWSKTEICQVLETLKSRQ